MVLIMIMLLNSLINKLRKYFLWLEKVANTKYEVGNSEIGEMACTQSHLG